jgi:hypothetical protein
MMPKHSINSPEINRRSLLGSIAAVSAASAVAGATAAVAASYEPAEPAKTPREQAIWHLRELERLVQEDGGWDTTVIVIGKYTSHQDCRMISIRYNGKLQCDDNMLAAKGGAA